MKNSKIFVTGGAGFIGSEFVRQVVQKGYQPIVLDTLTYAGDLKRLESVRGSYKFYKVDITDSAKLEAIFKKEKPQELVHFAAETHVDRSINDSNPFIKTNVVGTQVLLDISRRFKIKRFINISTDEVYGDIANGKFTEDSPLRPSSPYAAAKAASDLLIRSYIRTFDFPAIIIRPCNNYGPWQYPEKLIPLTIKNVLAGRKTPVYAKGMNVREWLFVADCAEAVFSILKKGKLGEVYNIGSGREIRNIDVVKKIITSLGKSESLIEFVKDRPGHDIRYFLDSKKITRTMGWSPRTSFTDGLKITLDWYIQNKQWKSAKARV